MEAFKSPATCVFACQAGTAYTCFSDILCLLHDHMLFDIQGEKKNAPFLLATQHRIKT